MSVKVFELADSPRRAYQRAERRFLIVGPETIADAKVVVINPTGNPTYCPTFYDGLVAKDYNLEEIVGKPGYYIAEITYEPLNIEPPENQPGGNYEFYKISGNFTTKGQVTTRFLGLDTNVSSTPYAENDQNKNLLWQPKQHGKAIGITEDGIEGVEVIIPGLEFTVTKEFSGSAITMQVLRTLFTLTGTVNNDWFLGFAPGELLFRGVDANYSDGKWTLNYDFAAQPNVQNLVITAPVDVGGNVINGVFEVGNKLGWEYLWLEFDDGVGPIAKQLRQVNKIKVYPQANFQNNLGI